MAQIAPSPAAIAREHTHTNTNERNAFASLPSISITSADSDTHLPLHTPTSTSASTSTHTYTHTRPVTQYDPYIPSDTETSDPIIPSRESSPTTSRGSQSTSRPPGQVTDGDDIGGKGDGSVKTIRAKKRASFPDLIQAASASAPSIVKVDQAGSATAKGGTAEMPVPPASSRLSTDTIRSEDSDTHRRPSMEEILPVGMDMRGALAKCEDPRLGWSLQFWITIVDPVTGHAFYACPATGQTSWTPPTGVFIVPRQVEGEWWELADTTRGNRSYFYNTLTKVTQWTRPGGDAFVVPLGLIQSATLPKREKDNGTSSGEKKEKGTASGQVADNAKSSRQGKTHAPKQDSIQLHQRELKKKRSNQQLRNATSNETIKGTAAQQAEKGQSGGRARAATVSSAAGDSKPLPLTPKGEGEDLPPHMGIQDQSYPSTPTSPFGPRIPLPPDSPSTPTRISTFSFRGIPTPSTPTPKISKLSQSTNSKDIDATRGSSSPQTPQTPESDMTMTPAHRRLRPLSVVGEELSGNEADDSSVSEVEHEHGHGPDKKGKVYGQKGGGGGQESMARRASLFTRRRLSSFGLGGILGKSPEGIPPVPRRGSSLSITSISAPSPIDSTTDLRALGLSPLSPSNSGHSLSTLAAGKGKDDYPYSPILASAKIHIEPTSRPIPIGPMHSSIDLSSSTAFSSSSGHGSSENALRTKRFSTGPHPLLPSLISSDIHAFQLDSFAEQYFAKRRTGIMRTRVPLARLLTWQKTAITAPLLEATGKNYAKEAVIAFKVIQRAMCERDKPVDGARPLRASSVAELETMPSNKMMGLGLGWQMQNLEQQAAGLNGDTGAMGGQQVTPDANVQILEEVRWVIQIAVFAPEMRDEVYAQVVKQLTGNQVLNAMVLGFQLFCVLVNAFSPSIRFEPFVRDFLARHIEQNIKGIGIMALYCQNKLESNRKLSTRARPLTIGEIEHASDAAFYPSIYGDSLDAIMQRQATTFSGPPRNPSHILGHTDVDGASTAGTLNVPVVLPFLARAIIHLGGKQAEGIFRVPGDAEVVAELKSRMDRGHYQLAGMSDPHVAASLYKLFLRELSEPVVPSHMYNEALESSSSPESAIAFLQTLPAAHRRVLVFVIFFTRRFCKEEVVRATKMTPSNLALVLAPNILRTISDSLVTVYTNAAFESKWILTLLQALQKEHLDKADWPEVNF